ncbi:unnamed protein product, partial [Ranitomeya imitator]
MMVGGLQLKRIWEYLASLQEIRQRGDLIAENRTLRDITVTRVLAGRSCHVSLGQMEKTGNMNDSIRKNVSGKTLSKIQGGGYCAPFSVYENGTPMAPCGAIANSMFNDTIILVYHPDSSSIIHVPMLKTGNTWWSDKNVKFSNPKPKDNLVQAFAGSARPPYWQKPAYALDADPNNNGYKNDDFINWMRVAAFPFFRKLYRRLSRVEAFTDGLPAGNYSFVIDYNFPVSMFGGKKHVILSTLSWCGGNNMFLGIAYTVTGAAIVLTAFVMLGVHLKKRKKPKRPFAVR